MMLTIFFLSVGHGFTTRNDVLVFLLDEAVFSNPEDSEDRVPVSQR